MVSTTARNRLRYVRSAVAVTPEMLRWLLALQWAVEDPDGVESVITPEMLLAYDSNQEGYQEWRACIRRRQDGTIENVEQALDAIRGSKRDEPWAMTLVTILLGE